MFFYHCSSNTWGHNMSCWHRKPKTWCNTNSTSSDKCRWCCLRVVHFMFSDFFTNCSYNSFPSYHSTWTNSYRNKKNNPPRNIISSLTKIIDVFLNSIEIDYFRTFSSISIFNKCYFFRCIHKFIIVLDMQYATSECDFFSCWKFCFFWKSFEFSKLRCSF